MMQTDLTKRLLYSLFFIIVVLVLTILRIAPLSNTTETGATPNIVLLVCFALALRRPSYVSPFLIALVILMQDMILQRSPGVWAGLTTLAYLWLQNRADDIRENVFLLEWFTASIAILFCFAALEAVSIFAMLQSYDYTTLLWQAGLTIACYPLSTFILATLFRVTKRKQEMSSAHKGWAQ